MSTSSVILILGVLYFGAHAFAFLFQRTRVPDVLLLMIIGLIIGPFTGIVSPENFGSVGEVLTTIALTVILFEGGLSLSLRALAVAAGPTLLLTATTAALTFGIVSLVAVTFLGLSTELALVCGAILCGTSSAVVIPMAQALKISERPSTILVLESALTDVISIVLVFALLKAVEQGSFGVSHVSMQIGLSLSLASLIGFLSGLAWLKVWPLVRKFPTTTFTTIAYAFILYGITELLGFSGAIATLVFGLTITNLPSLFPKLELPKMTEVERGFFGEVVFLLKTFFFVYLGLSIRLNDIYLAIVALFLVLMVYFVRIWITKYALPRETTPRDATLVSLLIPKGLAAAVLAGLPIQYGIPEGEAIQTFVYSVIFFSILITAILVPLVETPSAAQKVHGFFSRYGKTPPRPPDE